MDAKLRVGVIAIGEKAADGTIPRRTFNSLIKRIEDINFEKIIFTETVFNREVAIKAGLYFNGINIDLLLVINEAYTEDNLLIDVTKFLACPIILWSPEDPISDEVLSTGSFVGNMQNCIVLNKIGKKTKTILDNGKEDSIDKLKNYFSILTVIKKLKLLKIGMFGSRCPGMLDSSFSELELIRQIGPEIIHIGTSDLIRDINSIKRDESEALLEHIIGKDKIENVSSEILVESINIYIALKKYIKNYGLDALVIRCFPDLKNSNICSPCFALSKLSDEGTMSGCESDITAVISMYILNQLTKSSIYLGDIINIDSSRNEMKYFHCGAVGTGLAEGKNSIKYNILEDPGRIWKKGFVVEFPLKTGRVTFAKIGEINNKYRMVAYSGNAIKTDYINSGAPATVIVDKKPEYIIDNLCKHGLAHHQVGVHGDITNLLKDFCDFLSIEFFIL